MSAFGKGMLDAIKEAIFNRWHITACYANELENSTCGWGFRLTLPPRFIGEFAATVPDGSEISTVNRLCIYDAYIEVYTEYCCNLPTGVRDDYNKLSRCFSPDRASLVEDGNKTFIVFDIGQIEVKIDKASDPQYNIIKADINCINYK